jgi:hypothetical protein
LANISQTRATAASTAWYHRIQQILRPYTIIRTKPEASRRDVPKAEVHIVDGGHFALDTEADEIAALVRGFVGSSR